MEEISEFKWGDLLKLNEEMFFWIFASKETIAELIERSVQT